MGVPDREPGGRQTRSPGRQPWVRPQILQEPRQGRQISGLTPWTGLSPLRGSIEVEFCIPRAAPWAMGLPPSGLAVEDTSCEICEEGGRKTPVRSERLHHLWHTLDMPE